jgi:hypothetical protein
MRRQMRARPLPVLASEEVQNPRWAWNSCFHQADKHAGYAACP